MVSDFPPQKHSHLCILSDFIRGRDFVFSLTSKFLLIVMCNLLIPCTRLCSDLKKAQYWKQGEGAEGAGFPICRCWRVFLLHWCEDVELGKGVSGERVTKFVCICSVSNIVDELSALSFNMCRTIISMELPKVSWLIRVLIFCGEFLNNIPLVTLMPLMKYLIFHLGLWNKHEQLKNDLFSTAAIVTENQAFQVARLGSVPKQYCCWL